MWARTIKYVSHPGRRRSSSRRFRVSRYAHRSPVEGKQLSTLTVARLMTLEKSVIELVDIDEVEGVEGP
jgi:hypothetical protein